MKVEKILQKLKAERPVFHSEDDLKFAFSQMILKEYQSFSVRLERPITIPMLRRDGSQEEERKAMDIMIIDDNDYYIPIELKYKTRKNKNKIFTGNDCFALSNHGASDVGRVSFRKDIYRIEKFIESNTSKTKTGYVLIITNEKEYLDDISKKKVLNSYYNFSNGMLKAKDLGWNYDEIDKTKYFKDDLTEKWLYKDNKKKAHWTCVGDLYYKLDLKRDYKIEWKEYSEINGEKFYYCLIQINNN